MADKNKKEELSEIYKEIFNNASDGILIADIKNKKFLLGNKMICKMLGYSLKEIKNLGVTDIHPDESLPMVIEHFNKMSKKGIELARDIPIKRKDGSIFYADIKSFPIILSGKSYIAGIFRDITERKLLEEDIRESERKYRSLYQEFRGILDATPDALVLLSRDLKVIWSNEVAAKNMNMSVNDFIGQHCYRVRHGRSDPCEICPVLECYTTHTPKIVEAKTPDGRIWELHVYPIIGDKGEVKGVIEAAHNITERKRAEDALKQNRKEILERVNELEEFYNLAVGRELRMVELKNEIEKLKEELKEYKNL